MAKNTNETNSKLSANYRYGIYLNLRASFKFLELNNTQLKFTLTHQYLLSFFIYLFNDYKEVDDMYLNNVRYILVMDKLILEQNPILNFGKHSVKKYIPQLQELGFIKIHIVNSKLRYITIDNDLLNLNKNENPAITPVSFLIKHKPELYEKLKNEYLPHINNFKFLIDNF